MVDNNVEQPVEARVSVVANRSMCASAAVEVVSKVLPRGAYNEASRVIRAWKEFQPTPVVPLPDVAEAIGVESVQIKDEATRLGLGSFKALGGAYAVQRAVDRWRRDNTDSALSSFTVTCVTDGNHGLSVAWGARQVGCRCVIYVPDVVTEHREQAIRAHGAEVVRCAGNYDEVTEENAAHARRNQWHIVTDTAAAPAAVESATTVMQGYRVLAEEIRKHLVTDAQTHLILQAGCGGMAAAVVGHLVDGLPRDRWPKFVIVEPSSAACLAESARAGEPVRVAGDLATIMAGLSVGEVSLPAWQILQPAAHYFVSITDHAVPRAMRMLAQPDGRRPLVISGETGAAGLAGLLTAAEQQELERLDLDEQSRVLLINTEGDTDPRLYTDLVHGHAHATTPGLG